MHMMPFSLAIQRTAARTHFKKQVGHTTQYLLTIVVGLDAVRSGAEASPTLPARWNPQSKTDAADRARTFANQAGLVWTIEALNAYVMDLRKSKPPILPAEVSSDISSERDKEKKLLLLSGSLGIISRELDMVRAGMVWRNRLVHANAHNSLDRVVKAQLKNRSDDIKADYQGLDIEQAISRVETNAAPRLKETTAIMRAANELVRDLDAAAVKSIDNETHLENLLRARILEAPNDDERMRIAVSLWGGTEQGNARSITNAASQWGMTRTTETNFESDLASKTPKAALKAFLTNEPERIKGLS